MNASFIRASLLEKASQRGISLLTSSLSSHLQFLSLSDCQNPLDPTYLGILYTNSMNYDGDAALFPQPARLVGRFFSPIS